MSGMMMMGLHWTASLVVQHGLAGAAMGALCWAFWRERKLVRAVTAAGMRERRMREELEAYARLEGIVGPGGNAKSLAKRVCRTVVEKSAFHRAAMLLCDAEGRLYVAGSAGMDDLAVAALGEWGARAIRHERGIGDAGPEEVSERMKVGSESFVLPLEGSVLRTGRGCTWVIVTMLRGQNGAILGALAVAGEDVGASEVHDAMPPVEALAMKLARTIENTSLMERLMRAEKLAGLGQLACGVAHELNNPLTAVLGFSEMIAETAEEPRVQQDARTISREALRMKGTVESLLQFWRPVTVLDESVEMADLLKELEGDCRETLDSRGVRLVLQGVEDLPAVQGNRERMRQVFQHLLNNAAQAIANSKEGRRAGDQRKSGLPRGSDALDRSPEIRVTVRYDEKTLRMIVSDTGPGFPDAARAFDPFYTTREPGTSSGLGLSICYGIVREHGGEISAFNLHPHGAAVVVELPVRRAVVEAAETRVPVRGYGDLVAKEKMRRRQDQDQLSTM